MRARSNLGAGRYREHAGETNARTLRRDGYRERSRRVGGGSGTSGYAGPAISPGDRRVRPGSSRGRGRRRQSRAPRRAAARPAFGTMAPLPKNLSPPWRRRLHRKVALEKIAGAPIPDRDAEAIAEVVLGVPRDVDAVPAAFGSARSGGFLNACSAHAREDLGLEAAAAKFVEERDRPQATVKRLAPHFSPLSGFPPGYGDFVVPLGGLGVLLGGLVGLGMVPLGGSGSLRVRGSSRATCAMPAGAGPCRAVRRPRPRRSRRCAR